jgi:hypothetical protein
MTEAPEQLIESIIAALFPLRFEAAACRPMRQLDSFLVLKTRLPIWILLVSSLKNSTGTWFYFLTVAMKNEIYRLKGE